MLVMSVSFRELLSPCAPGSTGEVGRKCDLGHAWPAPWDGEEVGRGAHLATPKAIGDRQQRLGIAD